MSFEGDFDDFFGDLDFFNSKSLKRFQRELERILKGINSGDIKGTWKIRQIDEPGVEGYSFEGHFGSDNEFEPLEPIKPLKRRPLPETPFGVSGEAMQQSREPLIDVFEEEDAVKLYVELPGEEEGDIKLNVTEHDVEIGGKKFHKIVELPKALLEVDAAESKYKNGVLELTIPKKKELRDKDLRKAKMV